MPRQPPPHDREPGPAVALIVLLFAAVAIAATVALDFISGRSGGTSYLFPPRKERIEAPPERPPLSKTLAAGLAAAGVPAASIETAEDPQGRTVFDVGIPLALYEEAGAFLDRWLPGEGITILEKSREEGDGRLTFRWRARAPDGEEGAVLFVCPAPPLVKPPVKKPAAKKPGPGSVALIVDDMGNNLQALNDILGLGRPVTVAVLPYSTFARETAELAHANGLEVLLHLPLESQNNHDTAYGTDGMILAAMDETEILRILADDLGQVPFARGVNNHMGSRLTTDVPVMRTILGFLKERGLFFVDSRTTAGSVAHGEALKTGIPAAARDVFLDADEDRGMIRSRLLELFRVAQKRGGAVGICHPFPETLAVLKEDFHRLAEFGLEAVPVSRLLAGRD